MYLSLQRRPNCPHHASAVSEARQEVRHHQLRHLRPAERPATQVLWGGQVGHAAQALVARGPREAGTATRGPGRAQDTHAVVRVAGSRSNQGVTTAAADPDSAAECATALLHHNNNGNAGKQHVIMCASGDDGTPHTRRLEHAAALGLDRLPLQPLLAGALSQFLHQPVTLRHTVLVDLLLHTLRLRHRGQQARPQLVLKQMKTEDTTGARGDSDSKKHAIPS